MRFRLHGGKHEHIGLVVRNVDTVVIKKGAPTFLKLDGDGVGVVSSENLSDEKQNSFFGLATADIAVGYLGEVMAFGFFQEARIVTRTRAASTDNWPAIDVHSKHANLNFLTNPDIQALSQDTPGMQTMDAPFAILAQTLDSAASVASDTGNTALYSVASLKVFVRSL